LDFGVSQSRFLRITRTLLKGIPVIQWRGSNATAFNQDSIPADDGGDPNTPNWENYSEGLKTWRYIQIKVSIS